MFWRHGKLTPNVTDIARCTGQETPSFDIRFISRVTQGRQHPFLHPFDIARHIKGRQTKSIYLFVVLQRCHQEWKGRALLDRHPLFVHTARVVNQNNWTFLAPQSMIVAVWRRIARESIGRIEHQIRDTHSLLGNVMMTTTVDRWSKTYCP